MTNKMIFTGDPINAKEAKDMGILADVAQSSEELLKAGQHLATRLKNLSLYALIAAKRAVRFSAQESGSLAMETESVLFNPLLDLPGAKEGISAFAEKRKADFKDK
jgi:enoyl-CoA hydratase/carnithine racemase